MDIFSFESFILMSKFIFIFFGIIWIFKKIYGQRLFAYFMSTMDSSKNAGLAALKKDFFQDLMLIQSHDPKLKKKNALSILEIGVGTGANFEYYPEGTHLTVIDPNTNFTEYYNEKRKKFCNIHSEEIIIAKGEDMNMVPAASVDVVVMTLVMCSVEKTEQVLKEIHRVLVPGGKYFFYEHVKEFDPKVHYIRAFLQKFLTKSGIFPFFFDGCHLTRDMLMTLQSTGFSSVKSKRVHTPQKGFLTIISPHLIGTATK